MKRMLPYSALCLSVLLTSDFVGSIGPSEVA